MKHIHFDKIDSTSSYLKLNYKDLKNNYQDILVSASQQTSGRGRAGNQWSQPENSIAFSFTLKPSEEMTLSSLELGVLIAKFFKNKVLLKWPNDLLNLQFEKCGGILCQLVEKDILIVGIGINIGIFDNKNFDFPYPIGSVDKKRVLKKEEFNDIPISLFQFILDNRIEHKDIASEWNNLCIHLNKKVSIVDDQYEFTGIFEGINSKGAALIRNVEDNSIKKVFSGSLFIKD